MRIFLSGDEDTAKWHLPVAQAKFNEFVSRCKATGLKQDRFTFIFEDTGTQVFGQYFFGEASLQIYSPTYTQKEKTQDHKQDEVKSCPRTFYIETDSGYFWVIVRRDNENKLVVSLESFVATQPGDEMVPEFVYPALAQRSFGMLSGIAGTERFVVTQRACVFYGDCEKKGTIKLPASMESGRITVTENSKYASSFLVISGNAQERSVGLINITPDNTTPESIIVEFKYSNVSSILAAESGELSAVDLQPTPTWIHRKCSGSYFNPQKTIGFHVDIGSDDGFMGNLTIIPSGLQNKLVPEFNHSKELYDFLAPLQFPISVTGNRVSVVMVSPSMYFSMTNPADKCWGGYFWGYGAGCADYQRDFNAWMLSPRPISVEINLESGEKSFNDLSGSICTQDKFIAVLIDSWDAKFYAKFIYDRGIICDTQAIYLPETTEKGICDWETEETGFCGWDPNADPTGYTAIRLHNRILTQHLVDYGRETLKNTRLLYFIPGGNDPSKTTVNNKGYYFLFEGLWYLAVGVLWATAPIKGNSCGLCSSPAVSQDPGEYIWFYKWGYSKEEAEWIMGHGHEYVENLEITIPLGIHGNVFGFQAKVPDHFAAPHEPEVLIGGIEYAPEGLDGGLVQCERALMSTPCICEGNDMAWKCDVNACSYLNMSSGYAEVTGGCPPFDWAVSGGNLVHGGVDFGSSERNTQIRQFNIQVKDKCAVRVRVTDACGNALKMEAEDNTVGAVAGPPALAPGESAYYTHNLGAGAYYTGDLILVSHTGSSAILQMPENASGKYTVSWSAPCGVSASTEVLASICDYTAVHNVGPFPGPGALVYYPSAGFIYRIGEHTTIHTNWTDCANESVPYWGLHLQLRYVDDCRVACTSEIYSYSIVCYV